MIELLSDEELNERAEQILSGELLVADLSRPEWLASLALLTPALAEHGNVGTILVPFGPHLGMPWMGTICPGLTVKCFPVAIADTDKLRQLVIDKHEHRITL